MNGKKSNLFLNSWQKGVVLEIQKEVESVNPVNRSFIYKYFVSSSKGKSRKRKYPVEIELVSYRHNGNKYHLFNKFPFDLYATEVLGNVEDAEQKLIREVRKLSH